MNEYTSPLGYPYLRLVVWPRLKERLANHGIVPERINCAKLSMRLPGGVSLVLVATHGRRTVRVVDEAYTRGCLTVGMAPCLRLTTAEVGLVDEAELERLKKAMGEDIYGQDFCLNFPRGGGGQHG